MHGIEASREMPRRVGSVGYQNYDRLEGRGSERLYLIAMIDYATSRVCEGFVRSDSAEENMRALSEYLQLYGGP